MGPRMEAEIEAKTRDAYEDAIETVLRASGDDPVFIYTPDDRILTEHGNTVADTLRTGDGPTPAFDTADSVALTYEDAHKYRAAITTEDGTYRIRGGYPRDLFDRQLSTATFHLRNPDGTVSPQEVVDRLRP